MVRQNIKALGRNLEHEVVKRAEKAGLRASRQPMSGRIKSMPSDAVIEDKVLVEAKVRQTHLDAKGSRMLTIDLEWLAGVEKNALEHGYESAIVTVRPKGSQRILVLLDLEQYLRLLHKYSSVQPIGDS